MIQVWVDENTLEPFFPIVVVRVEVQCSKEYVVSSIGTRDHDFTLVIGTEMRVEPEVTEGDRERVVHRVSKVDGVRHIQVPEFNRGLKL